MISTALIELKLLVDDFAQFQRDVSTSIGEGVKSFFILWIVRFLNFDVLNLNYLLLFQESDELSSGKALATTGVHLKGTL